MSSSIGFDLSASSRVVESIINELYNKYSPLDMAGCLVINEFADTIASQLSFSRKLFYYLKSSSREQKFIDELTNICKHPAKVYGHTYYSVLRLLWLRFKELQVLENNPNITKLFALIDLSMNEPLINKVNFTVHNVAYMLKLHPEAICISGITPISLPAPSAPAIDPVTTPVTAAAAPAPAAASEPVINEKECPVCMTNARDTAIIECGHVLCNTCAAHLDKTTQKCPICRNVFKNIIKIYL
jgi:hypothetical protein